MINVTAATGQLGQLIVQELARLVPSDRVTATVRDPQKAAQKLPPGVATRRADYGDAPSLAAAFAGTRILLMISGTADVQERIAQHRSVVEAAARAGVERIVYTSFLDHLPASPFSFALIHHDTEEQLRASALQWTILRPSQYAELLFPGVENAIKTGTLATPSGDGRVGFITRADIARAAAAVAAGEGHAGRIYELTGPDPLSQRDVAAILGRVSGKPVSYKPGSVEAYVENLGKIGLPKFLAEALGGVQRAIQAGILDRVTDHVQNLTGRAPESVESFLRRRLAPA
jgi:NAD(P)H dehydrogenase (quinone)